ncbi:adenosylcobalamin-dependent ribonucleoside-diphosphate reductase [Aquabacterium sp.]|uniref:adenosylcobalamin-dependent ribonucleoside-diphosphate reductase n=1 Tax=Aquabacterium sp. TaxID=1872578 RepID=UPI002E37EB0C|nr:adenosylcobalamin-dependent ribonucleoside-diphosphate reductase [Aquabacterium sp.]HEX5312011.1 adenosylcobalamin-dependent ribonucleoside-diphosphate reductase [Aquabacterium sp.]
MNAPADLNLIKMEPQEVSTDVLLEKYAKGDETSIGDIHARVARALAEVEPADQREHWQNEFQRALSMGFVPAGRICSAAGTDIQATLINCFVQPVGDAVTESTGSKPSIYTAVAQAAETMRRGGGVGYDFSQIRPEGAYVRGTHSRASGPVSFMKVFDASCSTVESSGARRGAQMGVLRCDHPDIETFIHAKDTGALTNFNISIGVTDAFVQAVIDDGTFDLVHTAAPHPDLIAQGAHQRADGKWVYRTVPARDLWEQVMRSTYDHAEPGILYIDRMNAENNLWYCETIEATNPCAEQPLPDYGCCDLGSINLTRFVRQPFTPEATFDFEAFADIAKVAIRMLDNVLDVTFWPLPQQQAEAMAKRRVGLGFLGLGSALVMLGIRYNSDDGRHLAARITKCMRNAAYRASIELAKEKGAFPKFEAEAFLQGGFARRLPEDIRHDLARFGLRNSHLLSIAPTGTITLAFADNASNGIEPAFSWSYNRKKRLADGGHRYYEVADHAWRLYRHMGFDLQALPPAFVTALDMSALDHMKMLEAVQPFIDTSISKTVNVPADYPYDEFKDLYLEGWKAGLKGLATYRPNSVLGAVLSVDKPADAPASTVHATPDEDPLRKLFDSRPLGDLEGVTAKIVLQTFQGNKTVYLTVNFMRVTGVVGGQEITIERPVEFFMPAGQRDDGQQWITSTMRLLSSVARSGGSVAKTLESLREVVWDKGQVRCGVMVKEDGTQRPMFHDSEVAAIGYALQQILMKRGFLDAAGNQVPLRVLAERLAQRDSQFNLLADPLSTPTADQANRQALLGMGKKCPECGANELHKVDGCMRCTNCGHIGSCG